MMNDSVRNKLIEITKRGLLLKAIAVNAGISESELSRFKNGMSCLKESDMEVLSEYLNAVVIPQRFTITKEPEIKPKRKRRQVSLDLLRELD